MIDSKLEPQPDEGSGDKNVQQARRAARPRHATTAYLYTASPFCTASLTCTASRLNLT